MTLEIKDLAGLSSPAKKLIQLVSDSIGSIYRPYGMRREADAEAYKIRSIANAEADARVISSSADTRAQIAKIRELAGENPTIVERAKLRLLTREVEGLENIETIADHALSDLSSNTSTDPVSPDWRRRFFSSAENVCDHEMQLLWGKVLAGEVSTPGRFNLRTLDTLRNLSRHEAETFEKLCSIAFSDGWIPNINNHISNSINTAFKPFNIDYNDLLVLRGAGLLYDNDSIYKTFEMPNPTIPLLVHCNCNGSWMEISSPHNSKIILPVFQFTQAGVELQPLVQAKPDMNFLSAVASYFRKDGYRVKKQTTTISKDGSEIFQYSEDY